MKTQLSVKQKIMPHLDTVIEAREQAEQFISNIGDDLDGNKKQENEEAMEEGEQEHPDMAVKHPSGLFSDDHDSTSGDQTFRRIDLQNDNELHSKIKTLDIDQRAVLDKGLQFARQYQRARKHGDPWPTPPLLIVHGGAGSGKSHIIDVLSQMLNKNIQKQWR